MSLGLGLDLSLAPRNLAALIGPDGAVIVGQATTWYEGDDIADGTEQVLPNRNGAGEAVRGGGTAASSNDPGFGVDGVIDFDGANDLMRADTSVAPLLSGSSNTQMFAINIDDAGSDKFMPIFGNKQNTGTQSGVLFYVNLTTGVGATVSLDIGDGTSTASASLTANPVAAGSWVVVGWRYDNANDTIETFACDGATLDKSPTADTSSVGSTTSGEQARIGGVPVSPSLRFDGKMTTPLADWDGQLLSDAEAIAAASHLLTRPYAA